MTDYTRDIVETFKNNADINNAAPMAAYMKNKFIYFGIKSPLRKEISKPFLTKNHLPTINEVIPIARELWEQPQRELQYFALDLLQKYSKKAPKSWIEFYEELITQKSWWDTVDGLAAWQIGDYFRKFPEHIGPITSKWMASKNIWLQRTCLIFQLRYKNNTDFELMKSFIIPLADSKEFFIRKAIGWALRQYSKFNSAAVREFVERNTLSTLSRREALKLIG